MTADGGCAESLNVYLDNDEIAPVVKPRDITKESGIPAGDDIKKVFVHKTFYSEERIVVIMTKGGSYAIGRAANGGLTHFITLDVGEVFVDISSIGNTLIVSTSKRMLNFLYKDGDYIDLGDATIGLSMSFVNVESAIQTGPVDSFEDFTPSSSIPYKNLDVTYEDSEPVTFGSEDSDYIVSSTSGLAAINLIWEAYQAMIGHNLKLGYLNNPIMLRYAVELYDGSFLEVSSPILVGAGFNDDGISYGDPAYALWKSSRLGTEDIPVYNNTFRVHLRNPYRIGVYKFCKEKNTEKYKDIIKSVNIYASSIINLFPNGNKAAKYIAYESGDFSRKVVFDPANSENQDKLKDIYLSASVFYKIKSYTLKEIADSSGDTLEELKIDLTGENIYANSEILDETKVGNSVVAKNMSVYNGSVIANGGYIIIPSGLSCMNGAHAHEDASNASMAFRFHIDSLYSDELISYSRERTLYDSVFLKTHIGKYSKISSGRWYGNSAPAEPMTFISFPDSRCNKVDICNGGSVCSLEMKPHPGIPNCSYAWIGVNTPLKSLSFSDSVSVSFEDDVPENRLDNAENKLMLSLPDNPFVFPITRRHTFQGRILATAVSSTALSQGQFGQFPLYVFTNDGIWVMESAADGTLVSSRPLSREICSNPESVISIDQAVVFVTRKGLSLLQGSQITELSPFMNGRHWTIEEEARQIVAGQAHFCDMADVLADDTPFMAFMQNAQIGYDYVGKRLICINPGETYQYVYKMDTQTWHKIYHKGVSMISPTNSYPDCEILAKADDGTFKLMDFSTVIDGSSDLVPEKGIIATRPFDLDEPDAYKTITDVRVRGRFPKGAAKFILLGSHDGINFYTISTLRGKSWKTFRMIILADLDKLDRISWIDIAYETRLTNKLR